MHGSILCFDPKIARLFVLDLSFRDGESKTLCYKLGIICSYVYIWVEARIFKYISIVKIKILFNMASNLAYLYAFSQWLPICGPQL